MPTNIMFDYIGLDNSLMVKKILVYSDIHHDDYKNGLTEDDVVSIEDQFTREIVDTKADLWIFGGDRFASRNPYDSVRYKADKALLQRQDITNGVPGVMVVGNHDQWKKNARLGHSMMLTNSLCNSITVISSPTVDSDHGLNIYAIPAGFEGTPLPIPGQTSTANIAIYHGMLAGSKYQNGVSAEHGWSSETLNSSLYSLVICGDNHAHQKLDMLDKTNGWYVGAPMQHNWGDAGAIRGFMYFEIDDYNNRLEHHAFIKAKYPEFIKQEIAVSSSKDLVGWVLKNKGLVSNNMLKISIVGTNEQLSTLDVRPAQDAAIKLGARTCQFKPKYDNTAIVMSSHTSEAVTDKSVWDSYLKAKSDVLEDLDVAVLSKMAEDYF